MIDKIAYAAGDFGCNMSFGLKGTVQTFWLTYMMLETGLYLFSAVMQFVGIGVIFNLDKNRILP